MKNPKSISATFTTHITRTFQATLFILAIFLFSQSCNTVSTTSVGLSLDSLELADIAMQSYIDDGKLSGVSVLVLKDGQLAHQSTFGFADISEERALAEDAIFRIYSMTKPITAVALMILFDEGKFELDDQVSKYIPEFENTTVYVDGEEVAQEEAMTIRHLLTHTAGFTYGWDPDSYVDSLYNALPEGMWNTQTIGEMVKLVAEIPLKFQPATKWEYSISIDVAGYLVEVLSGLPFDEFLQTRVFDPLKMDDTGFEVPEEDYDRLAMIYTRDESTGELQALEDYTNGVKKEVTLFSGGGGLVSTIGDFGKFGQMLLNGGELNGERILNETTVDLIMSNQLPSTVAYNNDYGYGLGGQVELETGEYSWAGMASTFFSVDLENNMVMLAFTQYMPSSDAQFAYELKELLLNAIVVEK